MHQHDHAPCQSSLTPIGQALKWNHDGWSHKKEKKEEKISTMTHDFINFRPNVIWNYLMSDSEAYLVGSRSSCQSSSLASPLLRGPHLRDLSCRLIMSFNHGGPLERSDYCIIDSWPFFSVQPFPMSKLPDISNCWIQMLEGSPPWSFSLIKVGESFPLLPFKKKKKKPTSGVSTWGGVC